MPSQCHAFSLRRPILKELHQFFIERIFLGAHYILGIHGTHTQRTVRAILAQCLIQATTGVWIRQNTDASWPERLVTQIRPDLSIPPRYTFESCRRYTAVAVTIPRDGPVSGACRIGRIPCSTMTIRVPMTATGVRTLPDESDVSFDTVKVG